ncbi:hypothetical protein [Mycobacterium intracellulare]|uniref:hypothetical protein n=1 Tax=Mycobacterium intracellulare TaxID=1767 RepID=UPI001EED1699|nr:hypothetical protein [Mycobacterium intracellulare]MEE3755299.1 hypothetical protein [Mycobacterium intracellulare]
MSGLDDLKLRTLSRGAVHVDRKYTPEDPAPLWWAELEHEPASGAVFMPWISGSVLVRLHTRVLNQGAMYVAVTIDAVYASDEQLQTRSDPPEPDDWVFHQASEDQRRVFVRQAVRDAFPTLRAEMFAASSMPGIAGVMLDETHVVLRDDAQSTFTTS